MNLGLTTRLKNHQNSKWIKSLGLTIPIAAILWITLLGRNLEVLDINLLSATISYLFFTGLFFLMHYTGNTYKYRRLFFVTLSICVVIGLISHIVEASGFMTP